MASIIETASWSWRTKAALVATGALSAIALYGRAKTNGKGPWIHPIRALFGLRCPYAVEGTVKPGWEPVKAAFEAIFRDGWDCGSQLCIYHEGEAS